MLALLVAFPVAVVMSWHDAVTVWQTGTFFDTDDATRAVQLRDWMAGQGWFDVSAHRMGLPQGLVMHWSRVVDVPLAMLVRGFGLALSPDMAERAARIVYPLSLQAVMIAAMGYAARVLAGRAAVVPAGVLIVLGGIGCLQFEPGRIHHHSPQIILLTLMAGTTLVSLDPARARLAGLTGALVAASLAIGLENLPFIAVLLAVPPLAWVVAGAQGRAALLWLALGLAVAMPAAFVTTVGPARYGITTVDAFSLAHLVGALFGAAALATLALVTPHCGRIGARATALAAVGIAAGGALATLFPEILHGPYANVDPLVRTFWLDRVQEARPILTVLRQQPDVAATVMMPLVFGALATLVAMVATRGLARARWAVLLALVTVGFAGSLWEVRVASSLQPLALLGAAWAVARLYAFAKADGRQRMLLVPYAALAFCSASVWSLLPSSAGAAAGPGGGPSCLDAAAYAPLAALPPGIAFAPVDTGPYLLAHTALSVLAAPYHRNNAGNRAVIEGFLAAPGAAHDIVRAAGAKYLMVCGEGTGLERRTAPAGLAADLAAGRVPAWLQPLALGPTPVRVYAVQ